MGVSLSTLISEEQRASIRAPIEKAKTLPRHAFTSQEFYELEIKKIYSKRWVAVDYAYIVAEKGDVAPIELCEMPLLAVRGDDGKVRVFHNICPYDACPLVMSAASGQKELVSPYHGWMYSLDGKLIKTPYWDGTPEGNLSALGEHSGDLKEVAAKVWQDMLFVNIDGTESFDEFIAPLYDLLKEYRVDDLAIGTVEDGKTPHIVEENIAANWKTYYENTCVNILHEAFVHALYRESPEVPRVDDKGNKTHFVHIDGPLEALGYHEENVQNTYPDFGAPYIGKEGIPQKGYFITYYPNIYIVVMPMLMEIGFALPIGPEKVQVKRGYYYDESFANNRENFTERQEVAAAFMGAAVEDAYIQEAVQKARKSPAFEQAFYAPFWDEMHYAFSNMVLDDLEKV